jgi:hypothetical protein
LVSRGMTFGRPAPPLTRPPVDRLVPRPSGLLADVLVMTIAAC